MSEPTGIQRYELLEIIKETRRECCKLIHWPDGQYVLYADHERVVAAMSKPKPMSDAYARGDNRPAVLLAEIERLVALVDARDAQLATAQAAVWAQAATYLNEGEILEVPDELDARCKCQCFGILGRIATYFEQQAQQAREGE